MIVKSSVSEIKLLNLINTKKAGKIYYYLGKLNTANQKFESNNLNFEKE